MELTSAYMGKTLNSWKEIAVYLGLGVRTAQRWELQLNLPVHRIGSGSRKPGVCFQSGIGCLDSPSAWPKWARRSPIRCTAEPARAPARSRGKPLQGRPLVAPEIEAALFCQFLQQIFESNLIAHVRIFSPLLSRSSTLPSSLTDAQKDHSFGIAIHCKNNFAVKGDRLVASEPIRLTMDYDIVEGSLMLAMKKSLVRLAACFILLCTLATAQTGAAPKQEQSVPSIDGGLGPCSVEFAVKNADQTPASDAKIHVHIAYGFLGVRRLDLEVTTNMDGKARFDGLPSNLKKGLLFDATKGNKEGTAFFDPGKACKGQHTLVLAGTAQEPEQQ